MMRNLLGVCMALPVGLLGCPSAPECSADEPCTAGFECTADGVCVGVDAGPGAPSCSDTSHPEAPNLVADPGFECGTGEWIVLPAASVGALTQETTNTKAGTGALRLEAMRSDQAVISAVSKPLTLAVGETICARAHFRGTAANGHLAIRRYGSLTEESFSTPLAGNDWVIVPPSAPLKFTTTTEQQIDLRLILRKPVTGEALVVDDVALWKSPNGTCSER